MDKIIFIVKSTLDDFITNLYDELDTFTKLFYLYYIGRYFSVIYFHIR